MRVGAVPPGVVCCWVIHCDAIIDIACCISSCVCITVCICCSCRRDRSSASSRRLFSSANCAYIMSSRCHECFNAKDYGKFDWVKNVPGSPRGPGPETVGAAPHQENPSPSHGGAGAGSGWTQGRWRRHLQASVHAPCPLPPSTRHGRRNPDGKHLKKMKS